MFLDQLSKFSLQSLRVFVNVASLGSISKAAEALRLTQPAVSLQVHSLEQSLGFALFEKSGRKNILSPQGQKFMREVLPQLEKLERILTETESEKEGHHELLIGSVEGIGQYWLPRRFGRFSKSHENIRLYMDIAEPHELEARLLTGKLKMIITTHRFEHPQVHSQVLMDEVLCPVARKEILKEFSESLASAVKKGKSGNGDDKWIREFRWIGYSDSENNDPWADRWLDSVGIELSRSLPFHHRVNSYSVIKNLLLEGVSTICVAPLHTCERDLESGKLVAFDNKKYPPLKNRLFISYRQDSLTRFDKVFLEWITMEARGT